jgi:hypothetical protein
MHTNIQGTIQFFVSFTLLGRVLDESVGIATPSTTGGEVTGDLLFCSIGKQSIQKTSKALGNTMLQIQEEYSLQID